MANTGDVNDDVVRQQELDAYRTAMHDLMRNDRVFVPLPEYFQDERFSRRRKMALKTFKHAIQNLPHDPFIYCIALNVFDCFTSHYPNVKKTAFGCLLHAWSLNNQEFPWQTFEMQHNIGLELTQGFRMKSAQIGEIMERYRRITRPVPTLELVNYFVSILDTNEEFKEAIRQAARQRIICLTEIDIKYARYRPSVYAAAAVLFSTLQILPENFPRFKGVIHATCQTLNERAVISCLGLMLLTCTTMMLTFLHPPKENLERYEFVAVALGFALERVKVAILSAPQEPEEQGNLI